MNLNPQHLVVLSPQMPQQQMPQYREPAIPPRVRTAMEFLARLTDKTATVPMPTYSQDRVEYTPVDGQKLSDEEAGAQATACNLLSQYFAGNLQPCPWDKADVLEPETNLEQLTIKCPGCRSNPIHSPTCEVCGGNGVVMTVKVGTPAKRPKRRDGGKDGAE